MPSLGADMEAGTLLRWLVAPGDTVHRGDIVALVDTEKADIEVEIFEDGVVEELLVGPGAKVPVGTPLARLTPLAAGAPHAPAAPVVEAPATREAEPKAAPVGGPPAALAPPPAVMPPQSAVPPPAAPPLAPPGGRAPAAVAASPAARSRAAALGIDLADVTGSGPGGAVTLADVEGAAAAAVPREGAVPLPAARPSPIAAPATAPRRALAALMERANREVPHYYLATEVDLSRALAWLTGENTARSPAERLLPAVLLLKAAALAAREVPEINGFWVDGAFRAGPGVHLGVAISRKRAEVVVAALRHADRRPLGELMAALRDLVARARAGALRSSELADSTLTVTNLGELGVDQVLGVVYPPQVALVGFGRIRERPWAEAGAVTVRPIVEATLAADHRASDGYRGARFLARVAELLQKPEEL